VPRQQGGPGAVCAGADALGQPVSRVLSSVAGGLRVTPSSRQPHLGDHLSGLRRCRLALAAYPGLNGWAPIAPAWPCSGWGLPGRRHCCRRRWSLTPPFHPDPSLRRGGCFLWPCPQVSLTGCYPAPCPTERGLSSSGGPRSTWSLAVRGRPADPALTPSYRIPAVSMPVNAALWHDRPRYAAFPSSLRHNRDRRSTPWKPQIQSRAFPPLLAPGSPPPQSKEHGHWSPARAVPLKPIARPGTFALLRWVMVNNHHFRAMPIQGPPFGPALLCCKMDLKASGRSVADHPGHPSQPEALRLFAECSEPQAIAHRRHPTAQRGRLPGLARRLPQSASHLRPTSVGPARDYRWQRSISG